MPTLIEILQPVIFYCAVPVIYIFILIFVIMLVRGSPSPELRVRSFFGIFGGLLLALAFIILDVTTTGLAGLSIDPQNIFIVLPFAIVGFLLGFSILFAIDLFLRHGAVSFVILFIVWAGIVSAYFLIRASEMRGIIAETTVMFLFGNITYIMVNFRIVRRFLNLTSESNTSDASDEKWAL